MQDGRFIAAQVISIFAIVLSWSWWLTLLLGFCVFVTLQVAWCCKLDRTGVWGTAAGAFLAGSTAVVGAIYALVDWRHFKGYGGCPTLRQNPIKQ